MPSSIVTGIMILHMALGVGVSYLLNKILDIDTSKTFMIYFILLSWYYLHKLERIYTVLNNFKIFTKEQVNERKSTDSTP